MVECNVIWQQKLKQLSNDCQFVSSPRGMKIKEILAGSYTMPMPAYLSLIDRKINRAFMFGEAWWIISGSNRLEDVQQYMDYYKNFSDDQVFLRGAYGPKVIDQLPYIVETLVNDNDSRQAVLTTWRERPGPSKDVPCTVSMQFIIRNKKLYMLVTMRSNDIVLGTTYDVFTFSMVAMSVQLLLRARGIEVSLGDLTITAGSLHIYEKHWDTRITSNEIDGDLIEAVDNLQNAETYSDLILMLKETADTFRKSTQ